MTIDEAIQKSEEARAFLLAYHRDELAEATRLGTEALKRIKEMRDFPGHMHIYDIPGETD